LLKFIDFEVFVSIFFENRLVSSVKNNRIKKKIETPIDSYFVSKIKMESAFFYNTFFAVASPEPEPEFLVSTLPDDVLAHISKFINPKLDLMERYKKVSQKLDYWTFKPEAEYCAEASRWGYKETPKCYKGNGKIYKKANPHHLTYLKTAIWDKMTEKGYHLRNQLHNKWDDLFSLPPSPVKLPDCQYQDITGKISNRTYRLRHHNADGTEVWYAERVSLRIA
jgi:hypothetical protein